MSSVQGKVAAVTGAGSGIGRALALELARRGARLALSDVDPVGLAQTVELVRATGASVAGDELDVTDRAAVHAWAETVVARHGVAHQVYNNAGIALHRSVLESDWADYERVLGVNLWGVLHGTRAFLPHLVASGDGHVVNISSLNGYLAQAGMSHYCTSKFAVRGFTEALRVELEAAGTPVRATVVHPGGVRTRIADRAFAAAEQRGLPITDEDRRRRDLYNETLLRMDPGQAARTVLDGVEAGRPRVLVGNDAKAVDLLVRLLPASYPRVTRALERRLAQEAAPGAVPVQGVTVGAAVER